MVAKLKHFLFTNQDNDQRVAKNTAWLFVGEVFGRIIRFSIVVYATRLLGPSEYGVFAYVMAINAFLVIFSDIGVSAILTREAVRNPENRDKYLSSAFVLKLILTGINVIILLFLVPTFTRIDGAIALLPLLAFILISDSIREFSFGFNRAFEKMEYEAYSRIVMNVAIAVLGFLFLLQNPSAKFLIYAYIFGSIIGTLIILAVLAKKLRGIFSNSDSSLFWPILRAAAPIGLLGLLTSITLNTDLVMISFWRSVSDVGYYALAQKIILLLYVLPTLLASAAFPTFVRLAKESVDEFRIIFEKAVSFAFLAVLPMAVGGIILSDQIVRFFGAAFVPASMTLSLLLLSLIIVYPSTIIANALTAYDRQGKFLYYVAIGAIGNVIFNILLIPKYGIEGAAVSTIATQLLANTFVWFQMKRVVEFKVLKHLKGVALASVAVGLWAYFANSWGISIMYIISGAIVLYFGILLLLKEKLLFGE